MNTAIDNFIKALSAVPSGDDYTNIYREYPSCSNNLRLYLRHMDQLKPKVILVGEAPGYKGCARTGIPFTDEAHLIQMKEYLPGVRLIDELDRNTPCTELSAGVIWDAISFNKNTAVLLWNIYPFHPYKGKPDGNRTPRKEEVEQGLMIFGELRKIFSKAQIYTIGRVAQRQLGLSDKYYIRHPSYGGARRCRDDLQNILR